MTVPAAGLVVGDVVKLSLGTADGSVANVPHMRVTPWFRT